MMTKTLLMLAVLVAASYAGAHHSDTKLNVAAILVVASSGGIMFHLVNSV